MKTEKIPVSLIDGGINTIDYTPIVCGLVAIDVLGVKRDWFGTAVLEIMHHYDEEEGDEHDDWGTLFQRNPVWTAVRQDCLGVRHYHTLMPEAIRILDRLEIGSGDFFRVRIVEAS